MSDKRKIITGDVQTSETEYPSPVTNYSRGELQRNSRWAPAPKKENDEQSDDD